MMLLVSDSDEYLGVTLIVYQKMQIKILPCTLRSETLLSVNVFAAGRKILPKQKIAQRLKIGDQLTKHFESSNRS